jgi:hypothetical protein
MVIKLDKTHTIYMPILKLTYLSVFFNFFAKRIVSFPEMQPKGGSCELSVKAVVDNFRTDSPFRFELPSGIWWRSKDGFQSKTIWSEELIALWF